MKLHSEAIPLHNNTMLRTPHNPKLQRSSWKKIHFFFFSAAYLLLIVCLSLYSLFTVDAFHNTFALIFLILHWRFFWSRKHCRIAFGNLQNTIQARPSKNILPTVILPLSWLIGLLSANHGLFCYAVFLLAWLPVMDWSLWASQHFAWIYKMCDIFKLTNLIHFTRYGIRTNNEFSYSLIECARE